MNKKLFKAQALAIVMLILVIASIMGVALFSRMAKDKDLSVNEQDSAIALAQVDAVLDLFIGADIKQIEDVLGVSQDGNDISSEDIEFETFRDFLDYFVDQGILSDEARVDSVDTTEWCINNSTSNVKCTISYAEDDKYVEVQPGSVLAFNLDGLECTSNCNLVVNLKSVGSYSAFLLKRVKDEGGDVSEEKDNYCIKDNGNPCTSSDYDTTLGNVDDATTWTTDGLTNAGGGNYYFTFPLDVEAGNNVVEIRILPISGVLAFNNVQPEGVTDRNFLPIKVAAEATCNVTRGEEMYLPGSGLLGYSTLFDYGIYDNGFFQP
jgi:hypothetical protein